MTDKPRRFHGYMAEVTGVTGRLAYHYAVTLAHYYELPLRVIPWLEGDRTAEAMENHARALCTWRMHQ